MQKDMAKSEVRMSSHPPMELWVGFVNHVPLVGTSANMVDGFIALLQGDRRTAEAKGYKGFLDSAGIDELTARSILQNPVSQAVIGCSAEVSKYIIDHILMTGKKKSRPSATEIKAIKAVRESEQLFKDLKKSNEVLMAQLKDFPEKKPEQNPEKQGSKRGEHVFNNGLLGLYASIIELFIKEHVTGVGKVKLLGCIPNTRVSDAFQGHAKDGDHINLTAQQRLNISTWVVHIPNCEIYISVNDFLFGCMTEIIRVNAADYMHSLHLQKTDGVKEVLCNLTCSVETMIEYRVYLDPLAVKHWFLENSGLIAQFHQTEEGVKKMLRHLVPQDPPPLLCDFMNDLTKAVKETDATINKVRTPRTEKLIIWFKNKFS
ncbi:uncharacterized protein LOC118226780 isoform X2 [Anguilla anguilla]|uniref:uncharacterized protein LOC118226780 isoform X2 n=1 Tax=Anguilla anguilla TaxID=7936 RepID=UPI0015A7D426|nr:uncharacterized protein LOC118226780 isoform X2 [Anguilla anguilla]